MQLGEPPCKETLHFFLIYATNRGFGGFVSSFPFVSYITGNKQKKIQVPLNIIYWANTAIGELLVNSSSFLLFNPAPHWLPEAETSSFCKGSPKTCPLVSSGCFCTSEAEGKLSIDRSSIRPILICNTDLLSNTTKRQKC